MRRIGALGPVLLALASLVTTPAAAQDIVLRNATIVDIEAGTITPGRTIRLSHDRIKTIDDDGAGSAKEATILDLGGKFVLPGLWDMHLHPDSVSDLQQLVANGVTAGRIMWGRPRHLAWRGAIALGDMIGPRLFIAGPINEGRPPPEMASVIDTADGRRLLDTRDQAVAEARAEKAAGFDYIKVYNNLPAEAYAGLVAEGDRLGMPIVGHVPFEVGLGGVLDARQKSVEHLRGYVEPLVPAGAPVQPGLDLRSRTLAWEYADLEKLSPLIAASKAAEVYETPTLATRIFTAPTVEVTRYLASPVAIYMAASDRADLKDRKRIKWLSNFSEADWASAARGHAKQDAVIVAMQQAGIPILAGTDTGPWGFTLHFELARLVAAGLTSREALAAATINAARFAGVADRAGKIAPGYEADLLILDANPLEDIDNTKRIFGVVTRGRYLDRAALDALLAKIKTERATSVKPGEQP